MVSLWSFLDLLQMRHYQTHGAWLAPDSDDFTPKNLPPRAQSNLKKLKEVLSELASDFTSISGNPDLESSGIDFVLPFLLAGSEHGLSLHTDIWSKIGQHYTDRTPSTESNTMTAMTATIQALGQSTGRAEKIYQDQIDDIEKEIFKRK
eukprot:TRINITY_DN3551_c1_g1_i1.p1 TRINITY_DN3551_c1_g1~~TRINITY_DN3551_c1_g1_i1.p1  ORF type:complete len:149 (-),score=29.10 TRINITY_DN3551_c1_g1_i1:73-519(-)